MCRKMKLLNEGPLRVFLKNSVLERDFLVGKGSRRDKGKPLVRIFLREAILWTFEGQAKKCLFLKIPNVP